MKKLLVLTLVLSLASLANATLITPDPVTSSITGATVQLSSDDLEGTGTWSVYVTPNASADIFLAVAVVGSGSAIGQSVMGAAAPTDAQLVGSLADLEVTDKGNGDIWTMVSYTSTYPTGVWLTGTYSGAVMNDMVKVYDTQDGVTFAELGSVTIVPEPITLALLGLGGLFIRRK